MWCSKQWRRDCRCWRAVLGGVPEILEGGVTGLMVETQKPERDGAGVVAFVDGCRIAEQVRNGGERNGQRRRTHLRPIGGRWSGSTRRRWGACEGRGPSNPRRCNARPLRVSNKQTTKTPLSKTRLNGAPVN